MLHNELIKKSIDQLQSENRNIPDDYSTYNQSTYFNPNKQTSMNKTSSSKVIEERLDKIEDLINRMTNRTNHIENAVETNKFFIGLLLSLNKFNDEKTKSLVRDYINS